MRGVERIRGSPRSWGFIGGWCVRRCSQAVPVERKSTGTREAEAGTGDGIHRCGSGGGQEGGPKAAAHRTSDLVPDRSGEAGGESGGVARYDATFANGRSR